MTSQTKMYVLINTDHYMSPGKIAAQTAHAVARLNDTNHILTPDVVIVVRASGEQLRNVRDFLKGWDIRAYAYIDEGVNEVPPMTMTALVVEPLDMENATLEIFKDFKLL